MSIRSTGATAPAGARLRSPVFVGREREVAQVASAILAPPALVLVEGEAGVGKTRLVSELADQSGPTGVELWTSYDSGQSWTEARLRPLGGGSFQAMVVHPPERARASDQVSLKVVAWDADGNRLEQVTQDAYSLRSRFGH